MIFKVTKDETGRLLSYAIVGDVENSIEEEYESIEALERQFNIDQASIEAESKEVSISGV